MKDTQGLYYYPDPADTKIRVYVRKGAGDTEFRLWHSEYPHVWEQHGWISYAQIALAASMYEEQSPGSNPLGLYDIGVATVLIRDEERAQQNATS